jgi:hypothetical protein
VVGWRGSEAVVVPPQPRAAGSAGEVGVDAVSFTIGGKEESCARPNT